MTAKKRTSLDAIFGNTATIDESPAPAVVQETPVVQQKPKQPNKEKSSPKSTVHHHKPNKAASTQGKRPEVKQQTAYIPHGVYEQLRKLAFEEERKMHDYLMEGLDRVFKNRGLPSIDEVTRKQ
jgi:hypothetical protein